MEDASNRQQQPVELKAGMKVTVSGDGDGADGDVGTISRVWRSGRCTVYFTDGSMRNLTPAMMRVVG
jgi:hypothetical protein